MVLGEARRPLAMYRLDADDPGAGALWYHMPGSDSSSDSGESHTQSRKLILKRVGQCMSGSCQQTDSLGQVETPGMTSPFFGRIQ